MNKLLPLLALIALAVVPNRAHAAVDYVISANGILNCNDTSHGEPGLPVQSFSLGGTVPTSVGTSGIGAGKVSLSSLSVTRSLDGCSEHLVRSFLGEFHVPTLTFKAYRPSANGKPDTILVITLTNAIISSYQLSGGGRRSPGGGLLQL